MITDLETKVICLPDPMETVTRGGAEAEGATGTAIVMKATSIDSPHPFTGSHHVMHQGEGDLEQVEPLTLEVASLLNVIEKKADSGHGGPGKEDAARIAEDQHGDSSRIRTAKRSTAGSTPEAMRMNAPEEGQISRELADAGESS